jgi:hypothetical protein
MMEDEKPSENNAEEPIEEPEEAGELEPLSEVKWEPLRHKAETAAHIAYSLVAILAGSLVVQYVCTMILVAWGTKDSLDFLSKVFNAWLPVISGLVSAAVTYYFTKEREQ